MFLLPFVKYLKPFRVRIAFAVFCMFGVGFFGTYNLFLVKPALTVIFNKGQEKVIDGKTASDVALEKMKKDLEDRKEKHKKTIERYMKSGNWGLVTQAEIKKRYYPLEVYIREKNIKFSEQMAKHPKTSLWVIAGLLVACALINGIFDYGFSYNLSYALHSAVIQMKSDIFSHIMAQDMRFFTEKSVGFLMSRVTSDVSSLQKVFEQVIKSAALEAARIIFVITAMLILSAWLSGIVFLGILPALALLLYFAHLIKRVTRRQKRRQDVLSSVMNESLGNVRLIKALTTEDLERAKFHKHNLMLFVYEMQRRVAKFAASPIMELFGAVGLGLILVAGIYVVLEDKKMDPEDFILFVAFLSTLYKPLKHISKANVSWQQGSVSAQRIQEILSLQPTVTDPDPSVPPVALGQVELGISMRNVTFRYSDKIILDDISLEIPKGETTALVGRSGSGKSTIANLLLRLYDPDEGSILLDNTNLKAFRLKDLRRHFGIVTQETVLFNETVAQNIVYGSEEVDQQRMEQAARAAQAHDFIMELDGGKGYETTVGPSGCQLSGGQRQRIAIARAFYRDPKILVLDEATSSLDTQSEAAVQDALERLMLNRTVIVISHRLSTIRNANRIVVLDGGRLVEQGSHTELLAAGGMYANLCKHGEIKQD